MEEALIVLLQLLFELIVELLFWLPWDVFFWRTERSRARKGLSRRGNAPILIGAGVVGAALGGLSLVVWPRTLLNASWLRLLNFAIAPPLAGWIAYDLSRRRERRGETSDRAMHAWFAVIFSFVFVALRFAWARRP
jgi:hypothetical protein